MFSHVMVGANDIEESKKFYDAILGSLGYPEGSMDPKGRCFYVTETGIFAITKPIDGNPACHGNGSTIGFTCPNPEAVEAWHAAGLAAGGEAIEEPPGVRNTPLGDLHLAYLRDPAGNKVCALYRA